MAEYIEREAVHDLVRSLTKYALASPGKTRHRVTVDADDVDFGVDKIPSADVAMVRHGEWVVCGDGDNVPWMCSRCGRTTAHKYKVTYGKYCPNCGCKMDLEG